MNFTYVKTSMKIEEKKIKKNIKFKLIHDIHCFGKYKRIMDVNDVKKTTHTNKIAVNQKLK